jgi:hypothetical protein
MAYLVYPYYLQSYHTCLLYAIPCQSLNMYVWKWMDSLGVCEGILFRSRCLGLWPGVGKTNSIMDRGFGVCILAHSTEYLWWVQLFGYTFEVLGHPSRVESRTTVVEMHMTKMPGSAVKDRVRVTITCGNMLSVHTTYPL